MNSIRIKKEGFPICFNNGTCIGLTRRARKRCSEQTAQKRHALEGTMGHTGYYRDHTTKVQAGKAKFKKQKNTKQFDTEAKQLLQSIRSNWT